MTTMNEMIEATLARRAELQAAEPKRPIFLCGKTFEVNGHQVWCGVQVAQGATTWMRPHLRRTWQLDGKPIAAAKLAKILGE